MAKFRGKLEILPISSVHENESNIREGYDADKLAFIAGQIKSVGLIEPLVVYPHPDIEGDYLIREGNHRYLASLQAGETEIPCIVKPASDRDKVADVDAMLSTGRAKNPLRESEISKGIQLALDLGQDITTIGKKHGMSRTEVKLRAKMAQRPDKLSDDFTKGAVTLDTVKRIYELEDQSGDAELYERAIKELPAGADPDEVEKHIVRTEGQLTKERIKKEIRELGVKEAPFNATWKSDSWERITDEMSVAEHHEAGHQYYFDWNASEPFWYLQKESPEPEETPEPSAEELAEQQKINTLEAQLKEIQGVRTKSIVRRLKDRTAVKDADAKRLLLKNLEDWCERSDIEELISMVTSLSPADRDGEDFDTDFKKWVGKARNFLMKLPLTNLVVLVELVQYLPIDLGELYAFRRGSGEEYSYGAWANGNFDFYDAAVNGLGYVLDASEVEAMQYSAKRAPSRSKDFDLVEIPDDACKSCGTEPFEPTGTEICTGCAATDDEVA